MGDDGDDADVHDQTHVNDGQYDDLVHESGVGEVLKIKGMVLFISYILLEYRVNLILIKNPILLHSYDYILIT